MNRVVTALLSVLLPLVTAHGILVWRAAVIAHEDAERQACLDQAQATAVIALLAPSSEVDKEGRLQAMTTLAAEVDDC